MAGEQRRQFRLGDIHILDATTGKIQMISADDDVFIVISQPPPGKLRVINMYYDPELAQYVFEREEA